MTDPTYLAESLDRLGRNPGKTVAMAAKIVPLSDDRCAVFFDCNPSEWEHGERLAISVEGTPQRTPLMILSLPLEGLQQRNVILLPANGARLCRQDVEISRGTNIVAAINPSALQSPRVDQLSLLTGLSPKGKIKLLRALLTTGPSLFKHDKKYGGSLDGFERIIGQLLSSLSMTRLPLRSFRALAKDARVLSYLLPAGSKVSEITDLVMVTDGKAQRIPKFSTTIRTDATRTTLHLVLAKPLVPNATLIGISDTPLSLAGPKLDEDLRPLQPWLQRQTPVLKNHLLGVLRELRVADSFANSLCEELECPELDQPELEILYAGCCDDGLLYVLKVKDPRDLLSNARWVCGKTEVDVSFDRPVWHPIHGDVCVGYVRGFGRPNSKNTMFELWGAMRSRRAFRAHSICPQEFSGQVPDIFELVENQSVDRMLGQAIVAALSERRAPKCTTDWFGVRPVKIDTSLLIFVDATLDYPRALLTLLAQETGKDDTVTFLVTSDTSKRSILRRLAEDLNAITSCPIAVISVEAQALPSECLRLALVQQDAATTIVFNRACLPERSGWLEAWQKYVGTMLTPQMASMRIDDGSPEGVASSGCRIFNRQAVEALKQLPLGASSIEAELTRIERFTEVVVPRKDWVTCYDKTASLSAIQSRADTHAVSYLQARAV